MVCDMRKTIVLILFLIATLPAMAQRRADYGFSLGITDYLGDIKPVNVILSPGPAAQFFYRVNFNPRQAVRANLLAGYLSANDDNLIYTSQELIHSFKGYLGELGMTYEYNFFPYSTMRSRRIDYTPYIAAGAALSMVYNQAARKDFIPFLSIPFSAGFKVNIANNIGLELEYGFRKTFNDNFDGLPATKSDNLENGIPHTLLHNNDWYSFLGISVTWKIYNKLAGCPAFAEMDKDKKRKK